MDAVVYFKEKERMTDSCCITCEKCPLSCENSGFDESCDDLEIIYPEEAVRIIEEWSKAHPIQTNADKFKEVFGNNEFCATALWALPERQFLDWLDAPYEAPKGADK